MKLIHATIILLGFSMTCVANQSPYVGQEKSDIKSLTSNEIDGLLKGNGMGFAKAAELNQYPGPRHVLDLTEQLVLSTEQVHLTNQIFNEMQDSAIKLGTQLVAYEKQLDSLFSSGDAIAVSNLDSLLLNIGETKAKLRGVHLHAHLEMKSILTHHQVMMYDTFRGYSSENGKHGHKHKHTH